MTNTYRLALIGFGNVGQGLAKILLDRSSWLEERFDAKFVIVAISDMHKGSCYDPGWEIRSRTRNRTYLLIRHTDTNFFQ